MTKGLVVGALLVFLTVGAVHAVLPALAVIWPIVEAVATRLVIRAVGRQIIAEVGVAANDAAFVSTAANLINTAQRVGSVAVALSNGMKVDMPLTASAADAATADYGGMDYWTFYLKIPAQYSFNGQEQEIYGDWNGHNSVYTPAEAMEHALGAWNKSVGAAYAESGFYMTPTATQYRYELWSSNKGRVGSLDASDSEVKDGVRRMVWTANGWQKDLENDPDWSPADRKAANDPQKWVWIADDQNQHALSIYRDAAGSTVVSELQQAAADQVAVKTMVLNAENVVIETETTTRAGTVPDAAALTTPAAANAGQGSGSNSAINFPTDYARENTLQNAATSLDAIGSSLKATAETADPTPPESSRFNDAFFKTTFDSLKGWRLPGHASQCPRPSFVWNGQTYEFSAHCQLVSDYFGAFTAAMSVAWSVLGLFVVMRA